MSSVDVKYELSTGLKSDGTTAYRPEESIGGRRQFHGAKELFLSDHRDVQSADTIEGKCTVHTFKNYTKLDVAGNDDYFCRFEYNSTTGAFNPDRVAVGEDGRSRAEQLLYMLRQIDQYVSSAVECQRKRGCLAMYEMLRKFQTLCASEYCLLGCLGSCTHCIGSCTHCTQTDRTVPGNPNNLPTTFEQACYCDCQHKYCGVLHGLPDFAEMYSFIGSVFDPDTKDHVQKLKEMDPINFETARLGDKLAFAFRCA